MKRFKPGQLVEFRTMNSIFSNTLTCSVLREGNISTANNIRISAGELGIYVREWSSDEEVVLFEEKLVVVGAVNIYPYIEDRFAEMERRAGIK